MPGLPGVALVEAEAPRVRRQPAVGGRGAEVELGRAAVKRAPRRRDPGRVRVLGEELRLLGVGAKAGADDQVEAGARGRGGHAVEGGGDVGAHPLPLAVGERARVAAAARPRRHPAAGSRGPARPRPPRRPRPRRGPAAAARRAPRPGPAAAGTPRRPGKQTRRRRGSASLLRPACRRRGPRPGQVDGAGHVDRVRQPVGKQRRRGHPRQVVAHRARRRERRQVGGPLQPALAGQRAGDRDDRQRRDQQHHAARRAPPAAPGRRTPGRRPGPGPSAAAAPRRRRPAAPRPAPAGPPPSPAAASPPAPRCPASAGRAPPARPAPGRAAGRRGSAPPRPRMPGCSSAASQRPGIDVHDAGGARRQAARAARSSPSSPSPAAR